VAAERATVEMVAGINSSGEPVFEEVLVDRLDSGTYRVVATPGLVLGIAADDVVRITPDARYQIVERGGNLAVQVYGDHDLVDEVTKDVWELGGSLDGRADNLTVYTIPVSAGFLQVERVFKDLVARHPDVEWYFGNVYDTEDGVTPLNWWQ
jgi:hypothetical protein